MITSATTCLRVPCAKNLFCILGVVFDTLFGGGVGYTTELLQFSKILACPSIIVITTFYWSSNVYNNGDEPILSFNYITV